MGSEWVLFEERDGVGYITLNREEKLNALNIEILNTLIECCDRIETSPDIRVGVITGKGRAFIAGADIGGYGEQDFSEFVRFQKLGRRVNERVERNPKPFVAAVNGYALGGGLELALACDLIIASEQAKLGLPEVKLGLLPGGGGTQRLSRVVGRYRAKELVMMGRFISAQEAFELGIVNKVVALEALAEETDVFVQEIAAKAPLAVRNAKHLIDGGLDSSLESALSYEQNVLYTLFKTEDGQEGIRAFLEKREPKWKGR